MARDYGKTNVAPWPAAPAVGPAGSTYYNTTENVLYLSDGTSWKKSEGAPTSRIITAGQGLTGGGDLSADRTIDVGAGSGIIVAADAISVDAAVAQLRSEKGVVNGYAALDASGFVVAAQLPPQSDAQRNTRYGVDSGGSGGSLLVGATDNIAIGYRALQVITDGDHNVAVGANALDSVTTGLRNVGIGYQAGQAFTTQSYNVGVGYQAQSLATTTGSVGIGFQALQNAVSNYMVSIGYGAAKALTTGGGIVAIGYNALGAATTGGFSTAIGYMAGNVANGVSLTLVGYLAGTATTGSYNTLIGALAGQSMTTAGANTAVGYGALQTPAGIVGNATTTASNQTAVGRDSGAYSAGTGNEIVAVGYYAVANSDGVAIGSRAQAQGSNSVALGKSAVATVNNQIMLGAATHRVYVNNDPTADLEVATKRYVDTAASTGNEVAVQDTDPGLAFDIWYDKDAPDTAAVGVLPPGGTAGQFLTKATDVDYAVAWRTVVLPAAAMTQWMGTGVIPSGWLLCDGSAVSRTTYSLLYAAVGTAYGTGDGSTTFNLPNLKGRVPAGLDAAQTEFDALAKTGGANTVTLSAAQIPAHTHTTPAHDHTVYTRDYDFGAAPASGGDHVAFGATVATPRWSNLGSPDGGGTTGSAGSNVSHLNLQPYIVVRYIISTGGQ